jgi:hypothetical protein
MSFLFAFRHSFLNINPPEYIESIPPVSALKNVLLNTGSNDNRIYEQLGPEFFLNDPERESL